MITITVLFCLGLASASVILANQRFITPWAHRYTFAADFTEAPAVNPGQAPKVRIAGVTVGQITKSKIAGKGQARLTFSLETGHTIYDNARIVLRPTNPLNEMYAEVDPGGPPGKPLTSNSVIPASQTQRPIQPDEVLDHLDTRSRAALTDLLSTSDVALASAPRNLPAGLDSTDATLVQVQPVLDALRKRRTNISTLVTSLSKISTAVGHDDARLTGLMNATQSTLTVLSKNNGDLESTLKQLPGTTNRLHSAMTGVSGLTKQLDPALTNVSAAAKQLPSTLQKVQRTLNDLGTTVTSADPVVTAADPVLDDLRPLVDDVHTSLGDLEPVAEDLGPVTKTVVAYLGDLQAFIYNTNGAFSLSDSNGGFIRGHVAAPLPDAGLIPGSHGGNTGTGDTSGDK
ncbi:MlaD family protein [Streptomyces sp. NPDC059373]